MAEITASLVKDLREKTGAGMMDCKKALEAAGGDIEASIDWLRKKGLAAAAKKSGRIAAEGLVGVASNGREAAIVEVNAETDFVARNDQFQDYVRSVAQLALGSSADMESLKQMPHPSGRSVAEELMQLIATVGENMTLRRAAKLSVSEGAVATYIHNSLAPELGRIGVLVALESAGDSAKLAALGRQIAMHVAAVKPDALRIEDVDSAALDRERAILVDQAKASGKPDAIIDKMVEGRLRKYYEEVVLLEQVYVLDGETKVGKVVENAAKDVGAPVVLSGFVRFALGEGIDKGESDDFAAEVAKLSA
jgi:elongation factor Ts